MSLLNITKEKKLPFFHTSLQNTNYCMRAFRDPSLTHLGHWSLSRNTSGFMFLEGIERDQWYEIGS